MNKTALPVLLLAGCYAMAQQSAITTDGSGNTTPAPAADPLNRGAPGVIRAPRLIKAINAEYSDEARRNHIQGLCVVTLIVDTQGMPQNLQVVHCVNDSLAEQAIKAVSAYRFAPATKLDGTPVPVKINVQVNFRISHITKQNVCGGNAEANSMLHDTLLSPPDAVEKEPDAAGVYPYMPPITAPSMKKFANEGFCEGAAALPGNSSCDVLLTLDSKGRVLNLELPRCTVKGLAEQAANSLRKSKFNPAELNGKPVAVLALLHLEFGEVSVKP
jgi:TonB family protein